MKLGELLAAKGQIIGTSKNLSQNKKVSVTIIRNAGNKQGFVWVGQRKAS